MNNKITGNNIKIFIDNNAKSFIDSFNTIGDKCYYYRVNEILDSKNGNNIRENIISIIGNTLLIHYATIGELYDLSKILIINDKNELSINEDVMTMLKLYLFEKYEIDDKWKYLIDKNNINDIKVWEEILASIYK